MPEASQTEVSSIKVQKREQVPVLRAKQNSSTHKLSRSEGKIGTIREIQGLKTLTPRKAMQELAGSEKSYPSPAEDAFGQGADLSSDGRTLGVRDKMGAFLNRLRRPRSFEDLMFQKDKIQAIPYDDDIFRATIDALYKLDPIDHPLPEPDPESYIEIVSGNVGILVSGLRTSGREIASLNGITKMLRSNVPQLQEMGTDLLEQNFDLLVEGMLDTHFDLAQSDYASSLARLWEYGNAEQKQKTLQFFRDNIATLAPRLQRGDHHWVLSTLVRADMPEAIDLVRNNLADPNIPWKGRYLSMLLKHSSGEYRKEGEIALGGYLGKALESEVTPSFTKRMLEAWREGSVVTGADGKWITDRWALEDFFSAQINNNVQAIRELSSMEKGCVQVLEKEFGLRNFARYPIEMLVKQYQQKDDKALDYVALVTARYDHNGAFAGEVDVLRQFANDLVGDGSYAIRAVEVGTRTSLLRRVRDLNMRYGQTKKIGGLVIRGHGEKDSIQLGYNTGPVSSSDVQNFASESSDFFLPGAPFAFISCSTGQDGGIAQQTAESLGVNPKAPDNPTGVTAIIPEFQDGKLIGLTPEYTTANTASFIGHIPDGG